MSNGRLARSWRAENFGRGLREKHRPPFGATPRLNSEHGSSPCAAARLCLGSRTEPRHSRPAHEPFSAISEYRLVANLGNYVGVESSIRKKFQSTSSSNTLLLLLLWVSIGSLFYGARVGGEAADSDSRHHDLELAVLNSLLWGRIPVCLSVIPVFAAPGVLIGGSPPLWR